MNKTPVLILIVSVTILSLGFMSLQADDVTPPKRHHKHPKPIVLSTQTAKPIDQTSPPVTPPINPGATGIPEIMNQEGTRNPGAPNMGTGDHSPGTTGTSGQ